MKSNNFFIFASACAILSTVTTLLLIFLPNAVTTTLQEQLLLINNSEYLFKKWVYFFHPIFSLVSIIGLYLILKDRSPGFSLTALVFIIIWAHTEAQQQALEIDGLNQYWRAAVANSTDQLNVEAAKHMLLNFRGLYDSHYFLLLFTFGIGSLINGLILIRGIFIEKTLGVCFTFFGLLSLLSFSVYYMGVNLENFINWCYQWIYTVLQPFARLLLAYYLISVYLKKNNAKSQH